MRKKISKNTRIGSPKNVGKKSSQKSTKTVFYKQINIVAKKWGEKSEKFFFPETHVYCKQKRLKKSSGKSAKQRFL